MLESAEVLIATPPKTGARALEAASRIYGSDFRYVGPLHSVLLTDDALKRKRDVILMVREPHARLVSMWSFNKRNPVDWASGEKPFLRQASFNDFIRWIRKKRDEADWMNSPTLIGGDVHPLPWRWVLTLAEMEDVIWDAGYRCIPYHMENMERLPEYLAGQYGVKLGPIPRRNTSDRVLGGPGNREEPRSLFSPRTCKLAEPWLHDGRVYEYQ